MEIYWQVDVKVLMEQENGKMKRFTEKYLVNAFSPTDAEAKITKLFEDENAGQEFEVVKVSKTKILKIVE